MKDMVWTPALAEELKTLRLKYSIEQTTLARETAISLKQLIQLEDGGCSAFYSEQIKYQVGKKILALLTGDSTISTNKKDEKNHSFATTSEELKKLEKFHDKQSKTNQYEIQNSVFLDFWNHYKFPSLLFVGLSTFIVVRFVYDNITKNNSSTDIYESQVDVTRMPNFSSPVKTLSIKDIENLKVEEPKIEKADVNQTNELKKCEIKSPELTLRPNTAAKPSNYVYIQATNDASVCIVDGDKKTKTLALVKDTSNSVYGQPPWQISSYQMDSLKIFFQGNRIFVPSQSISHVLIQELN